MNRHAQCVAIKAGWGKVALLFCEHLDVSRVLVSHVALFYSTLRAKQSFRSNKTHRKLCEVLTTYQNLFYRKTLKKKSLSFIWATGLPLKKR